MNWKCVYIRDFNCPIVLFITIIGIIIEPSAAIRVTKQCSPANPLCEYCDVSNKSLCLECKNLTMCSNQNSDDEYRTCLKGCPKNSYEQLLEAYYRASNEPRFCCQPCFEGCLDGCTGNQEFNGDKGCNKCKYAVMLKSGHFLCLKFKSLDENKVCIENNFANYYVEPSKKTNIAKFECKKCSDNCESCSSFGNDVHKDHCICASGFEVIKEIQNGTEKYLCAPKLVGALTDEALIVFLALIFLAFVIWLLLMSAKCYNNNCSSSIPADHTSLSNVRLIPSSKSTPKKFELPSLSSVFKIISQLFRGPGKRSEVRDEAEVKGVRLCF